MLPHTSPSRLCLVTPRGQRCVTLSSARRCQLPIRSSSWVRFALITPRWMCVHNSCVVNLTSCARGCIHGDTVYFPPLLNGDVVAVVAIGDTIQVLQCSISSSGETLPSTDATLTRHFSQLAPIERGCDLVKPKVVTWMDAGLRVRSARSCRTGTCCAWRRSFPAAVPRAQLAQSLWLTLRRPRCMSGECLSWLLML